MNTAKHCALPMVKFYRCSVVVLTLDFHFGESLFPRPVGSQRKQPGANPLPLVLRRHPQIPQHTEVFPTFKHIDAGGAGRDRGPGNRTAAVAGEKKRLVGQVEAAGQFGKPLVHAEVLDPRRHGCLLQQKTAQTTVDGRDREMLRMSTSIGMVSYSAS